MGWQRVEYALRVELQRQAALGPFFMTWLEARSSREATIGWGGFVHSCPRPAPPLLGGSLVGPAVPTVGGFNNSQFQMKNLAFCPRDLTLISVPNYARGAFGMTLPGLRGPQGVWNLS